MEMNPGRVSKAEAAAAKRRVGAGAGAGKQAKCHLREPKALLAHMTSDMNSWTRRLG